MEMEDIEDVLGPAGIAGGGAAPGLRLPLAAVAVKPKRPRSSRVAQTRPQPEARIPGTQSDSEYMSGQLSAFGYAITEEPEGADLWLINTCTVKNPSQSAMTTLISKCKSANKPLVVAGCVPQGSRDLKELEGISVIGVQQIDRVVEVVEETLKGHEVRLLSRKTLPSLDLPKVRKNKFIEILPINVGCLGACTYCKTKHARGHLGSYTIESLVDRVKIVVSEGVREIWLSSEDTGAYVFAPGPDLFHNYTSQAMNREYTVSEFRRVVDTLCELVPGMQIATDIICGFPGETDEDFSQTVNLVKQYLFPQVHISQFYPRPGTPAARMKKVPSVEVKKRSRELTSVFESFSPYQGMEGKVERIWITEIATDGVHLVGHTKGYIQVLVIAPDSMLGTSADVKITSVGRWSVFGEVIEGSVVAKETQKHNHSELQEEYRPSQVEEATCCGTDSCGACTCSDAAQQCNPGPERSENSTPQSCGDATHQEAVQSKLVRRNVEGAVKSSESDTAKQVGEIQRLNVAARRFPDVDTILWGGLAVSFATTVTLIALLAYKISSTPSY
uniref:tRNA (N(6)-L-threonylcarbamoyladenosine(37)-C(2))-methylthiotransferase n=1 Tax=Oryza sativa subsp. japonica TaxID=39947 RepID=Q7X6Q6_ORYSJ|nr:OSJNBb0086G13.6 [Oryza sativa Japonica Group]